jgi:hypothetical protein
MSRLVEGQLDCTSDYNDLVPLLLGIRKYFDEIALIVGSERTNCPARDTKCRPTGEADQEFIYALLGLFSLRQRLDRWLSQCTKAASCFVSVHSESSESEINLLR